MVHLGLYVKENIRSTRR